MADLIERSALIHEYYKNPTYRNLCNAINSAPTIEPPPIVRCANCRLWGRTGHYKDGTEFVDCKLGISEDPYGYCYIGEAKHETD